VKHPIAQQQDFGGHMPGAHGAGLVPASRRELFLKLQPLIVKQCRFVNLPETGRSRWGENLTAEKMKQSHFP
jgi:hypothetical protein